MRGQLCHAYIPCVGDAAGEVVRGDLEYETATCVNRSLRCTKCGVTGTMSTDLTPRTKKVEAADESDRESH